MTWPAVELDPIQRVEVLAAALPGTVVHRSEFDQDLATFWSWISDLERSVPAFDSDVSSLQILSIEGANLRIRARGPWWMAFAPIRFDVRLEEGFCWMTSRLYVVGMGAVDHDGRTIFAHCEGVHLAGPSWLRRVLRPVFWLSRFRHHRHVRSDLAGMRRALANG